MCSKFSIGFIIPDKKIIDLGTTNIHTTLSSPMNALSSTDGPRSSLFSVLNKIKKKKEKV